MSFKYWDVVSLVSLILSIGSVILLVCHIIPYFAVVFMFSPLLMFSVYADDKYRDICFEEQYEKNKLMVGGKRDN